jgi:hypothetical protein
VIILCRSCQLLPLNILVPDRNTGSCLDPGLLGTSLQRRMGEGESKAGPGPTIGEGKDRLESSRDGRNIMGGKEEPIGDVMQKDQQQIVNSFIITFCNKRCVNLVLCCVII